MSTLTDAWSSLMTELSRRAPVTHGLVNPPDRGLDALIRSVPHGLPAELAEWFGLHGGAGSMANCEVIPNNPVVSISESLELNTMTYEIWSEFADDLDLDPNAPAGSVAQTWLRDFVYVTNDLCGGGLFVDTRPGELRGCVRHWDKTDADGWDEASPIAESLTDLVAAVTRSLTTGEPFEAYGYPLVPSIADGTLEWSDG